MVTMNVKAEGFPKEYFKQFHPLGSQFFGEAHLKPFNVSKKGFTRPINPFTGKRFPDCCKQCTDIYRFLAQEFSRFPNCCPLHRKSASEPWFNAELYKDLPNRVLVCLHCTINHINKNIKRDDWFEDIKNYIEYNIVSFGIPTMCCEWYLHFLKDCLMNTGNVHIHPIQTDKRDSLIKFVFELIDFSVVFD